MTDRDPRPYIAVTNELFSHPKFVVLPDPAKLWLIELWAWCNQHRTDGIVPKTWALTKGKKTFDALCTNGWIDPHDRDHVQMHDYLRHQKSKAELEEMAKDRREAGRLGGLRSNHTRNHVRKGVFDPDCQFCADLTQAPDEG